MVHVVCSDGGGINKAKQAKMKLEQELNSTLNWELSWKIKSNLAKSNIQYIGTIQSKLLALGGIRSNNVNIPLSHGVTALGANVSNNLPGTQHANKIANLASGHLSRIRRFNTAPQRVKKTLYKTLIRPILNIL